MRCGESCGNQGGYPVPVAVEAQKQSLRRYFRQLRRALDPAQKDAWDSDMMAAVLAHPAYHSAQTLLVYVALPGEIDTSLLVERALADGKTVAAPRCTAGTRDMLFYCFESRAKLCPGSYGIYEPAADETRRVTDFTRALCVVPGLSFDEEGYRLGYGGGYYDRFLAGVPQVVTMGLCYDAHRSKALPRGEYDKACDYVLTEKNAPAGSNK